MSKEVYFIRWVFPLILTALAIFLLSQSVMGARLLGHDDFTGTDGDPPDESMWIVSNRDSNDYVRLDGNTLRIYTVNGGASRATTVDEMDARNFTILVDWKMDTATGRLADLRVLSSQLGTPTRWLTLYYDGDYHGWGFEKRLGGSFTFTSSYVRNAIIGEWYTLNLTCHYNYIDVNAVRISTGSTVYTRTGIPIDSFLGPASLWLGVSTSQNSMQPRVNYDNYRFYDNDLPPNKEPVWLTVPTLNAFEEVPLTYDFSGHVSDPDGSLDGLTLDADSPYVTCIDGLSVTFSFPEGITEATIPMVLSDGYDEVAVQVLVLVTPVNDPPEASMPYVLEPTEDVPFSYNLSAFVSDVDNPMSELSLVVDDRYVSAVGLTIFATFPEGITEYQVQLGLTDGQATTWYTQNFTIQPVDDPPVVAPLGTFTAMEGQESVFDLTPFLSDPDTPVANLSLIVRSARCTVYGQELHFHYEVGGVNETILVQVTDGMSRVDAYLEVVVVECEDAPIVHPIPLQTFREDEAGTLDLTEFIEDEDTGYEDMTLICDDPAVVDVSGLTLTLEFPTWVPESTVFFNVSDGTYQTAGHFLVNVVEMNDPPIITGVGEFVTPVVIRLEEGSSGEFPIQVVDEDDHNFRYYLSTSWSRITLTTSGVLEVDAVKGSVGRYQATLTVEDPSRASTTISIIVEVMDVNDPIATLDILKPSNHTVVDQGVNLTFSVRVDDPDIVTGQVLTVSWVSNISGTFMIRTTEEGLSFAKDDLPVGVHRITVSVTDGEHVKEGWFELEVTKPHSEREETEEPIHQTLPGLGLIIAVVLAVVVVVLVVIARTRGAEEDDQIRPPAPPDKQDIVMDVMDGSQRYAFAALGEELGKIADDLEASKGRGEAPSAPVVETLEIPEFVLVEVPTAEELAERKHAEEVREVMKALTQLPRGLPVSLNNYELTSLASKIVDGPRRRTPDGETLVEIDGKWYTADHTITGSFMQPHREVSSSPELSADDRAKKLDQLEARLLEGKISEETYNRLRKKYGDA
jgi:uncharacterized membrane protein